MKIYVIRTITNPIDLILRDLYVTDGSIIGRNPGGRSLPTWFWITHQLKWSWIARQLTSNAPWEPSKGRVTNKNCQDFLDYTFYLGRAEKEYTVGHKPTSEEVALILFEAKANQSSLIAR